MNIAIKIPNADRDERIGSVFNHLFLLYCRMKYTERGIILFGISRIHHFFIRSFYSLLPYIEANVKPTLIAKTYPHI